MSIPDIEALLSISKALSQLEVLIAIEGLALSLSFIGLINELRQIRKKLHDLNH